MSERPVEGSKVVTFCPLASSAAPSMSGEMRPLSSPAMSAVPAHVPPFSQQNIRLPDGTETLPGAPLIAESAGMAAYLRTVNMLFGSAERANVKIADVGCLEGCYTAEFARAGYDATGIEVRAVNMKKCQFVSDSLGLPNLRFVQDDAANLADHGPFDAVLCSGLLYHLENPAAFLQTLADTTRRVLLLETHYATRRRSPSWALYRPWQFSRMIIHEGNPGRWYREYADDAPQEQVENALWASYGNPRSFWIEKRHLLRRLLEVGFSAVYEQYDFLEDVVKDSFIQKRNRSLFVAIRDRTGHAI